jgi:putative polyhydroxyalkanoate system protein
MADIHIQRDHPFTLAQARQVATGWADKAQAQMGMTCHYSPGDTEDLLTFSRAGVTGTIKVCAQRFVFDAKLGFLYGSFKDRIETEINQKLDRLLAGAPPRAQA